MKAGRVVRIRVNPKDVMSILDAMKVLGLDVKFFSLDNCTRIVLSALLEGARQQHILPDREGFEYQKMLDTVRGVAAHAMKMQTTVMLDQAMGMDDFQPKAMLQPQPQHVLRGVLPQDDPTKARRKVRYEELAFKAKADPASFVAELTVDSALQAEYEALCAEFA